MQNSIAISTGPDTHLDHLGVLADLLEIPLIVTEEKTFHLAKKFYPNLKVFLKSPNDLSLDFIAKFDRLLQCGQFFALDLQPLIELLYRKQIRILFCPHGNSDKGHLTNKLPPQDVAFVYGDQMKNIFSKKEVSYNSLITTGNYRFPYYRKNQTFYDQWADIEIFSKLCPKRKTLLYAPTWNDGENLTTFFSEGGRVIEELIRKFNLIVKLHPLLEEHHPAEVAYLLSHYERTSHLLILQKFPPIYPLLARTSAYLGDFSSIGYDFLSFDRPLFFLNPSNLSLFLHNCGMTIPPNENICTFIENNWHENQNAFRHSRRKTYRYAFGEEQMLSKIKNEILSKS
ncbi:MAG: CDP-glycerol glycerophosphotransferase family protein [Chlamydiota bacterium]